MIVFATESKEAIVNGGGIGEGAFTVSATKKGTDVMGVRDNGCLIKVS